MGLIKKYFANMGKPEGRLGKIIVFGMNSGHASLSEWGFSNWSIDMQGDVLDVGCGGGANLARWLERVKNGVVNGMDYSEVSVKTSKNLNAKAVEQGHCRVQQGNVCNLPFADNSFKYISAFETIYFWPEIAESFKEIYRVLKSDGNFFICNEVDGAKVSDAKWTKIMDGMTIYTEAEIKALLEQAGFSQINVYRNEKRGWISFSATKQ